MSEETQETQSEREAEYRKQIKGAKDFVNWNMLYETYFFDDTSGHIAEYYGNLGDLLPEVKVLTDYLEKVRRASFLLNDYNRDILWGNKMTLQDFQWLMMKVMDEEVSKISDADFRKASEK